MPGLPNLRITDPHTCPSTFGVPVPHPAPGCPTVMIGKLISLRMTDICPGVAPHPIAKGSMTVMIGKLPAARMGMDPCAVGGASVALQVQVMTGG